MGNIISRFCTCHNEEELGAAAAAVAAAAVCVICRDEESTVNTVFIPCGHICTCLKCLGRLQRDALQRQWGTNNLRALQMQIRRSIKNFRPTLECPVCRGIAHGYRIY